MKYGTLTDLVYSEDKVPQPKIGDGATLLCYSDRHAYTVVGVEEKYILVTRDIAERTDQNFEVGPQEYIYSLDSEAEIQKAVLNKDGNYYLGGKVIKVGYRSENYDYSF